MLLDAVTEVRLSAARIQTVAPGGRSYQQERAIGRTLGEGRLLSGGGEHQPPDFGRRGQDGSPRSTALGSAVFVTPPAAGPGGYLGEALLG